VLTETTETIKLEKIGKAK